MSFNYLATDTVGQQPSLTTTAAEKEASSGGGARAPAAPAGGPAPATETEKIAPEKPTGHHGETGDEMLESV